MKNFTDFPAVILADLETAANLDLTHEDDDPAVTSMPFRESDLCSSTFEEHNSDPPALEQEAVLGELVFDELIQAWQGVAPVDEIPETSAIPRPSSQGDDSDVTERSHQIGDDVTHDGETDGRELPQPRFGD